VPVLEGAGVRVYVRVVGLLHPGLAVTHQQINSSYPPFAWLTGSDRGGVSFDVVNTGNAKLNVTADIKAVNLFGSTVKTYPAVKMPAFLPGSTSFITEPVIHLPRMGLVEFDIALRAKGVSATGSAQQLLIPWVLVVIVVVVIVMAGAWWWRRRRRKKAHPEAGKASSGPPSPAPKPTPVG
jgi:hypothetical protein